MWKSIERRFQQVHVKYSNFRMILTKVRIFNLICPFYLFCIQLCHHHACSIESQWSTENVQCEFSQQSAKQRSICWWMASCMRLTGPHEYITRIESWDTSTEVVETDMSSTVLQVPSRALGGKLFFSTWAVIYWSRLPSPIFFRQFHQTST